MTSREIARVAHEVNRAYCQSIGDNSQVPWSDAPEWQQESAIKGVEFAIANPKCTPEDMHKSWVEAKAADGWLYGEVKDPEKKTHPCMVPYDQIPQEQRAKDYLFRAVVKSLMLPIFRVSGPSS